MSEQDWHSQDGQQVVQKLKTDVQNGLAPDEANRRLEKFGPNVLQETEKRGVLDLVIGQFKDAFVIMLLIAAVLSYFVGRIEGEGVADTVLIAIIVALSAVIGFVQEYRSEKALEAMRKMTAPTAKVIRGGEKISVPSKEIVPGDIVILESGDRVPADGRLIEASSLKTDEAPLTGESTPIEKSLTVLDQKAPVADRENSVFMGTHTVFGHGKVVITRTGMDTEFGKIAGAVQSLEEKKTPLKTKLDKFARKMGVIIIGLCLVILLIEIVENVVLVETGTQAGWINALVEAVMTSIALAVSAVPEALPALVVVTLALGARELADRNAVVRKLASAETLGSTTVICADKTGTLTRGEMTVRKLYSNKQVVEVTGAGYSSRGDFYLGDEDFTPSEDIHFSLLLRIGAMCNNAEYDGEKISGDPTEGALIVSAAKAGMRQEELQKEFPRVDEIPFSSERKRMTTVHEISEGKKTAYVKGAPEVVLENSTHVFENGDVKKLSESKKQEILQINKNLASQALRVLGMAYRDLSNKVSDFTSKNVEKNLIFVGLEGLMDPPREEAKQAVKRCKKAGIKNIMITGDHKLTAVAIAKELGIMKSGDLALTGTELEDLSDEEYEEIVEDVRVYARASPMHKLKIIDALKEKGEIVAMTGDGVNDAPALKRADIGVAMGITGTDVSKEAADMVLADDNYATLVNAVGGGRSIFDNIRKYIRYLISTNFDELAVIGGWAIIGPWLGLEESLPLLPIQILWINLVTDGPPAIALSVDPPTEDIMERPPRDPQASIFHGMLLFIIVAFICQSIGSSICFAYGNFVLGSYEKAVTMVFMQASLFELSMVWNCRSETKSVWSLGRKSLKNKFFVLGTIACLILTVSLPFISTYIPAIGDAFGITPLNLKEWAIVIFIASWGLW
ncbi:MAG: cation-translocating P-type ATPase, partial [Thermoproteota archaeon]